LAAATPDPASPRQDLKDRYSFPRQPRDIAEVRQLVGHRPAGLPRGEQRHTPVRTGVVVLGLDESVVASRGDQDADGLLCRVVDLPKVQPALVTRGRSVLLG
jgi:hypothetical protein